MAPQGHEEPFKMRKRDGEEGSRVVPQGHTKRLICNHQAPGRLVAHVVMHDIFGDGVNIAARLEALAEPGEICVSRVVRDQERDKVDFGFEDLAEQSVKNIARLVRVYRVRDRAVSMIEPLAAASQPLLLPDKPSIAVLPFANMSGDPEQDYFADGMVEEIITALSRIRWLFVIAILHLRTRDKPLT